MLQRDFTKLVIAHEAVKDFHFAFHPTDNQALERFLEFATELRSSQGSAVVNTNSHQQFFSQSGQVGEHGAGDAVAVDHAGVRHHVRELIRSAVPNDGVNNLFGE